MQQVTTKSFAHIFSTTRKAVLFLLILAMATGAASVQAKPPPSDPPPDDDPGGIIEVLAVLDAIQSKLTELEIDIDVIKTTTGETKAAVAVVQSTTETIKGTTGETKAAVLVVKSTTETIKGTTGETKDAIGQVKLISDSTKADVEIVRALASRNLEESLFSMDVCFDVGLGLGTDFGMDASLTFNAEGRVGAEAFGNGVIGRVQGDAVLAGSLKSNIGAKVTGITCIDIKQLAELGIEELGSPELVKLQLEDLAAQLKINPARLSIAMDELPAAASSLLQPDLSLLNISSGSVNDFDALLGALPLPDKITVESIKNQTSDLADEFESVVGGFSNIESMCIVGIPEDNGIPASVVELTIRPICNALDPDKGVGPFAIKLIESIWDVVNPF